MKKILLGLALCALATVGLHADWTFDSSYGPFVGLYGGKLSNQSAISGGTVPLVQYCTNSFVAEPAVPVVVGMPLVYVSGSSLLVAVSGTATAGDVNFAGYALNAVAAATTSAPTYVNVCTCGVIRAYLNGTVTVGQQLMTSGTDITITQNNTPSSYYYPTTFTPSLGFGSVTAAGFTTLTPTSAISNPATYTSLSTTAFRVGRALQAGTYSGTTFTVDVQFP